MTSTRGGELGRLAGLIAAYDKWDGVMTIGARDARTEMERACTAYVRAELSRAEGGFVVVPRELTREMVAAARIVLDQPFPPDKGLRRLYAAMLAAAPASQAGGAVDAGPVLQALREYLADESGDEETGQFYLDRLRDALNRHDNARPAPPPAASGLSEAEREALEHCEKFAAWRDSQERASIATICAALRRLTPPSIAGASGGSPAPDAANNAPTPSVTMQVSSRRTP